MATNDKAKEKLLASMRMTKAGADASTDKPEEKASPVTQEAKPAKKKKETAPAKKATKESKSVSTSYITPSHRIWPD